MKEALHRFFAVVSYGNMRWTFASIASDLQDDRNTIRKKALQEIDKLNPKTDGENIHAIMLQMNSEISLTYEKETVLRDFIDKCK